MSVMSFMKFNSSYILPQVQFCVVLCHTTNAFFIDCQFPRGVMYLNFFYVYSLLVLFINFYVRTYVTGRSGKDKGKVVCNGVNMPLEDKKHH